MRFQTTNKINSTKKINKIGTKKAIKHMKWFFTLLGIWFLISKNTKTMKKFWISLVLIFNQSLLAFILVPSFVYVIYYEQDIKIKIALFGPIGVVVSCFLKYVAVIIRRKNINKCIEQLKIDWKTLRNKEEQDVMMKNLNHGVNITIFCATAIYIGGVSHQIFAPFLPGSIISIVRNSTGRPLIYPVYDMLFNTQTTPTYEIIYLSQVLIGIVVCTMAIATCNVSAIFVTHICGQVHIMMLKLTRLSDIHEKKLLKKKTGEIIQLHTIILMFSSNIQKILGEVCLIEVIASSLFICMDEYYCLTTWRHNEIVGCGIYSVLLLSFIFHIFLFCYMGELLKEQYIQAGQSAYMMEWYKLPVENARALIIIIKMSQNTKKLNAGGIMELSFNGFTTIIKNSAAYLNILRMIEF